MPPRPKMPAALSGRVLGIVLGPMGDHGALQIWIIVATRCLGVTPAGNRWSSSAVAYPETVCVPFGATRAVNAASWFLRFDLSVLVVPEDQQRSDRSFRHGPIIGGQLG